MALAPASPSTGALAKVVEPTPFDFLSLPRDVQAAILKRVEEAAKGSEEAEEEAEEAEEAEADVSGGDNNSLLPLRLVSRAFQNVVDGSMTKFTCHIKSTNKRDRHLLARLDSCFQHVLLRWPGIHDLCLIFGWKTDYLEYVLAAATGSCRGLKSLKLTAGFFDYDRPMQEGDKAVACLSAIGQWTALQSLSIRGPGYLNCFEGLSALSTLPRLQELVLVDTRVKVLAALPTLTALRLEENSVDQWPLKEVDSVDLSKLPLSTKLVRLSLEGVHVDSLLLPPSLTELTLNQMSADDKFRKPATLPNLASLSLEWIDCETVPWITTNTGIQKLALRDMWHKGFLPNLSRMSTLQTLTLLEYEDKICLPPISDLTSLTELNIRALGIEAEGVPSLPPLDRLRLLRTLHLNYLSGIEVIPGLSSLLSLQELGIRTCRDLKIPADLPWQLTQLTTLKLVHIKGLSGLPPPPGSVVGLRELELGRMSELRLLELSPFQALTSLQVYNMPNLVCLEGLEKLTALRKLGISYCPHVKTAGLSSLPSLQKMDIYNCPDLEILMDVSWQLTQLTTLRLMGIKGLSGRPPPPGSVVGLRKLVVWDLSEVQRLELSAFQALTSLEVSSMPNLVSLEGLEKLTALRDLEIQRCPHVKTAGLSSLLSLQKLEISNCLDLENSMDVSWQLTQLTTLRLVRIKGLSGSPPPPGLVVGLRELRVGFMSEVRRLELAPFQALTSLRFTYMPNLVCLEGLEKLTALRKLDISKCPHVKTADLGQSLPNLENFTVEGSVVKLREGEDAWVGR